MNLGLGNSCASDPNFFRDLSGLKISTLYRELAFISIQGPYSGFHADEGNANRPNLSSSIASDVEVHLTHLGTAIDRITY